ncbi:CRISPR-associated helicase Cas3' [Arcticibacter eurypsychrophilus]|uniref:CRISPR-associated helicase Cas3' n=1 Tax=Arcticibacter eurypsychrophilus TaxID=1434752 RepID=UPI00084D014B|nr:CRISPR-associated helicase Cas3' [Arcticibacter eurypsychrophilus]
MEKTNHSGNIILGKPSGISLKDHTQNVIDEGKYLMSCLINTNKKYLNRTGKELSRRIKGACQFHDEGKKESKWQEACQKDHDNFVKWQLGNLGKSFEDYTIVKRDEAGQYLRNSGIRHEIFSLILHGKSKFSNPVQVAIAAHHAKLNHKHEERWIKKNGISGKENWKEGIVLWKYFTSLEGLVSLSDFKDTIAKFYEYSGVRSYLQIADHRASAKESNNPYPSIDAFHYSFNKNWTKRPVQEIVDKHWEDMLMLLRAPTGAGKTDAALLWASKQIENGRAERLVIAMPTRFASNALAINTASSLSNTGLYHSSAWFNRFHKKVQNREIKQKDAKKEHELARLILTPVTVCTIDHLMMAMTLSREDQHTILFNLANSCVVIDEADFYDEFTQANILVLLEFLNLLDVPVMIMSASLPESSLEMYRKSGYKIDAIREDIFEIEKPRCAIKSKREYSKVNELSDLLERCILEGKAIIYVNTVARAIEFYEWFKKKKIDVILYHSRFTEPDKLAKEEYLIEHLGKEAWQNGTAKGIAILTQIGEMSVNISADIMISEICPIDRLVQRAGRLCRFNSNRIGELYVIIPQKDDILYPAPYGTFIQKKGWEPIESFTQTLNLLEIKSYSPKNFIDLVNNVYPTFKHFSTKSELNAKNLKWLFLYNWVIGSKEIPHEDENDTSFWKSRDIVNSSTVYVTKPESNYSYWSDLQAFKCEFSIELPKYLIEKGIKNFSIGIETVYIGNFDTHETVYYAREGVYSSDFGLLIKEPVIDDRFL